MASSSFSRYFIASCRSESIAYIDTADFSWHPHRIKCCCRMIHISLHTSRIRFML